MMSKEQARQKKEVASVKRSAKSAKTNQHIEAIKYLVELEEYETRLMIESTMRLISL